MKVAKFLTYILPLFLTTPAFTEEANPYFSVSEMGDCLIELISKSQGKDTFLKRLQEAERFVRDSQESIDQILSTMDFYQSQYAIAKPGVRMSMEYGFLHSTPLLNQYHREDFKSGARKLLEHLQIFYRARVNDRDTDYTVNHDFHTIFLEDQKPASTPVGYSPDNFMINGLIYAKALADPAVKWMLSGVEKNSLSHWRLIEQVTKIYNGDVLNALGVLGVIFDEERAEAIPRKKRAYLGTRLKPIFTNDLVDPVGYNYHFFAYMNLALQGRGTAAGLMSWAAETFVGDSGDATADQLGLAVGKYVRRNLTTRPTCKLQ